MKVLSILPQFPLIRGAIKMCPLSHHFYRNLIILLKVGGGILKSSYHLSILSGLCNLQCYQKYLCYQKIYFSLIARQTVQKSVRRYRMCIFYNEYFVVMDGCAVVNPMKIIVVILSKIYWSIILLYFATCCELEFEEFVMMIMT